MKWIKNNEDKPLNYLKCFDYWKTDNSSGMIYYARTIKSMFYDKNKTYSQLNEELQELATKPCLDHKWSENEDCIYCGATKESYEYHKKRGFEYLGNNNLNK